MSDGDVGAILRETVLLVLKVGGPPLAVAMAVGLVMSLVQVVTQINEQTWSFAPKVIAIAFMLIVLGPLMLTTMSDFARIVFDRMVAVGGS